MFNFFPWSPYLSCFSDSKFIRNVVFNVTETNDVVLLKKKINSDEGFELGVR